jgi:uncharacterized protein involved in exopolysaccharide biosynthesis
MDNRNRKGAESQIDLVGLAKALAADAKFSASLSLACGMTALLASFFISPRYESSALVMSVSGNDQNKLSVLAGQLGGLATLAGFGLAGTPEVDKATLAMESLKSREFLGFFARSRGLDVALFAGESWDPKTGKWSIDSSAYIESEKKWVRSVPEPYTPEPDLVEIQERLLNSHIKVKPDKKSGLIQISVLASHPRLAKAWLEWLIKDLNAYGREREITEKQRNISYLKEQIQKTDVAELRQIFFELIQKQQSDLMLASTQEEFVFKTIDAPSNPLKKASPKRLLMAVIGAMLGALAGSSRTLWRRRDELLH